MEKFGKLSESVVSTYTRQICEGLRYLHHNNIAHRDIKVANILVDDRGTIKLADFGASKAIQQDTIRDESTKKGLTGTPLYMAPEVVTASSPGRKADIWAIGCTVLELATGQMPWKALGFRAVMPLLLHIAHSGETPPVPETGISDSLRSFLGRCFQRDPALRATADELLQHPFLNPAPLMDDSGYATMSFGGAHSVTSLRSFGAASHTEEECASPPSTAFPPALPASASPRHPPPRPAASPLVRHQSTDSRSGSANSLAAREGQAGTHTPQRVRTPPQQGLGVVTEAEAEAEAESRSRRASAASRVAPGRGQGARCLRCRSPIHG